MFLVTPAPPSITAVSLKIVFTEFLNFLVSNFCFDTSSDIKCVASNDAFNLQL